MATGQIVVPWVVPLSAKMAYVNNTMNVPRCPICNALYADVMTAMDAKQGQCRYVRRCACALTDVVVMQHDVAYVADGHGGFREVTAADVAEVSG